MLRLDEERRELPSAAPIEDPHLAYRGETAPRRLGLAVLLNLALPGLGHLYCGRVRRGLGAYALSMAALLLGVGVVWGANLFLPRALLIGLLGWLALQAGLAATLLVHTGEAGRHYVLRGVNHPVVYFALFVSLGLAPAWVGLSLASRHLFLDILVTDRNAFPVLLPGDRVYGLRSGSLSREPERGDLVVVEDSLPRPSVLRVVGLPGDEVAIEGGTPVVGGRALFRERIGRLEAHGPLGDPAPAELEGLRVWREHTTDRAYEVFIPEGLAPDERPPLLLGEDEYYLLADLRGGERVLDSRRLGPIPRSQLLGRPAYVWWSTAPSDGHPRLRRIGVRLR